MAAGRAIRLRTLLLRDRAPTDRDYVCPLGSILLSSKYSADTVADSSLPHAVLFATHSLTSPIISHC
jgi:hypothetical protein